VKSTLSVEEYQDAPRDIRDAVDLWLEKIGMLEAGVVDIKIVHRLPDERAIVALWYYIRNEQGRISRDEHGKPVVNVITLRGVDVPPLGFFNGAVA
jgi:hypothetical protein